MEHREFARVTVQLDTRFRIVEGKSIDCLEARLAEAPTVWAPEGERALVDLANSTRAGSDALMAKAILDITRQVRRLRTAVRDPGGPMEVGRLTQLSGGGGRLVTTMTLEYGACLDLRLLDDDTEPPPVRLLAEVVHGNGLPPGAYGLKFRAMHRSDRDRLIRHIYRLQRRELRRVKVPDPSPA